MKYKFIIEGSQGDLYNVIFNIHEKTLDSSCSCIAGKNGNFCKHRYQILNGNISNFKSDNYEELEKFYNQLYFVENGLEEYFLYKNNKRKKGLIKREKDRLEYLIAPEGFNIKGLGKVNLKKLIENGAIKTSLDIFKLKEYKDAVLNSKKICESTFERILLAIEESKNIEYANFIYSLGIPYIGEYLSNILSKENKDIREYFNYNFNDFINIDGVGEECAMALYDYFNNEDNRLYIEKLIEVGINIIYEKKKRKNQTLNGKKVAFTGKLKTLERREVKKITEELGGESTDAINENLHILVVGEKAGSKLQKAQKISTIEILTEEEFINKYY
ncbi:BRCA1 C Terminus (BRCT) domain-containing protein [Cetobacterium ceti]|uniref:BRCA1 C Terminus (BRCT) domain-containing protein n=1 Tax=Cetobacterium ceti TaxID=180163 RepID=A0A1T4PVL3_9FUSO|nr:helix-hairpin-helix domain-containing protein [Cetobacterium ceti]SJZ95565.1 BRCA1 C Terminus (BRCT) domain-containing protein [Cetobacterium ceti]